MSIKVRLRLYARDIDLIAAKQNSSIQFGDLFRNALSEYVSYGYCSKVNIPKSQKSIRYEKTQTDITIFDKEVIEWLSRIPSGFRCTVVKIILRSAINNPDLSLFMDKEHIEEMMQSERESRSKSSRKVVATPIRTDIDTVESKQMSIESYAAVESAAMQSSVVETHDATEYSDEFDGDIDMFLDDLDIENY